MTVININCQRKEYRKVNDVWRLHKVTEDVVDSHFITSMLEGGYYFAKLGGSQYTYYTSTKKFKNMVTKVVVNSICGSIKCVYTFSYSGAKLCDNIDYLF